MGTTRRDLLKLGGLAAAGLGAAGLGAGALLPGMAQAAAQGAGKPAAPRPGKPMNLLILGGTGFTGPHQVRYALERGHKVTVFNRGRREMDWGGEVEELTGDRDTGDLSSLKGRKWDVCIDNPTSVPFWVRDAGKVLAGNVDQYIFISTISVFADMSTPPDESAALAPYEGADAMAETPTTMRANMALYGPLKALSEKEAEKQFPGKATIIRPGLIVGPGDPTDRFTYWPLRLRQGGEVLAPSDGSDPVQFIDGRDLAEWTVRMAENRTYGIFNATGPDYEMRTDAMLYGMRACTTAGAQLTFVPAEFLAEQNVAPWGDMPVWVPGTGDSAGFGRVNIQKALAAGLTFRSLANTTQDLLAWYDQQPAERRAEIRAGIKADREKEVLAAWKAKASA